MIANYHIEEQAATILGRFAWRPSAHGNGFPAAVPGYIGLCGERAEPELQRHRNPSRGGLGQRVRIALRPYQEAIFNDRSSGILILHWSRQIGKSFTLAAWAVDRL